MTNNKIQHFSLESSRGVKFILIIALIICGFVESVAGQATLSESWVDYSNLDVQTGEGISIFGRGVSEVDYTSEDAVEVETTITSPTGRTYTSNAFGEIAATAQVSLPLDWKEAITFYDTGVFSIQTTRYPVCNDGWSYEDGPLIEHGYSGGRLYWYPAGFRRCPRSPVIIRIEKIISSIFSKVGETNIIWYKYTHEVPGAANKKACYYTACIHTNDRNPSNNCWYETYWEITDQPKACPSGIRAIYERITIPLLGFSFCIRADHTDLSWNPCSYEGE
jgi:hypothetical protein